jgi:pimeloyl-ACP methyl ester carboxylesterase
MTKVGLLLMSLALSASLAGCAAGEPASDAGRKPGELATLPDGRRINLRCTGRGTPTVVLESGFGAWSTAWGKVQPVLARTTRVCAYDRAGYGFSDVGPLPRDGANIARDLDYALRAAREKGPFLVVGHSAGGLYGRLFAARRKDEVVGLVLVDPTVERRAPSPEQDGLNGMRRRLERCLASVDAPDAACTRQLGRPQDETPAARREAWEARLSELNEIFARSSDQVARLGTVIADIPAYVITASETADAAPKVLYPELRSVLELQHEAMAAQFRNGSRRTVFSSHLVMNDRPDTVIDAAQAMITAYRAGEAPPPLPPSESAIGEPEAPPQNTPLPGADAPPPTLLRDLPR